MTFKGSGMDDLRRVIETFPRTFTTEDLINHFGWPQQRARQCIVNGQQNDIIRVIVDHRGEDNRHAIYENARWRREWLTKPWRRCG